MFMRRFWRLKLRSGRRRVEVEIFHSRNLHWLGYKRGSSVVYYFIPKTCRHWIFIGNWFSRVYLARKGGGNVSWLKSEGHLNQKTGNALNAGCQWFGIQNATASNAKIQTAQLLRLEFTVNLRRF